MYQPKIRDPIEAVGFDFDLTLADTKSKVPAIVRRIAQEFRVPFSEEHLRKAFETQWHVSGHGFIATALPDVPENLRDAAYRHWSELEREFPPVLYDGAIETLEMLAAAGIHLAVLSARAKHELDLGIELVNIREYFAHITSKSCVEHPKPDPRKHALWLRHLKDAYGIDPPYVAYVGDTHGDVTSALASHQIAIAVETGHTDLLIGMQPHVRLPSIKEVGPWILEHNARLRGA